MSSRKIFFFFLLLLALLPGLAQAGGDWLHVSGNKILTSGNGEWYAKGVNVMDSRLNKQCSPNSYDDPNRAIKLLRDAVVEKNARFARLPLLANLPGSVPGFPANSSNFVTNEEYRLAVKRIVDSVKDVSDMYIMVSLWFAPSMPK